MRCSARYLSTASRNQMSSTQSVVISDALLGAVPVDRLAAGSPICEVVDDDEPACQERRVEMQSVAIRCDPRNQTSSAVRTWREPRVEHGERLVGGPIRIAVESNREEGERGLFARQPRQRLVEIAGHPA